MIRHRFIEIVELIVPWFPRKITDLDKSVGETLDAGDDLESDHPGFKDQTYRERRNVMAQCTKTFRQGQPIPRIEYTPDEVSSLPPRLLNLNYVYRLKRGELSTIV